MSPSLLPSQVWRFPGLRLATGGFGLFLYHFRKQDGVLDVKAGGLGYCCYCCTSLP